LAQDFQRRFHLDGMLDMNDHAVYFAFNERGGHGLIAPRLATWGGKVSHAHAPVYTGAPVSGSVTPRPHTVRPHTVRIIWRLPASG
jgi:hypothetical protein